MLSPFGDDDRARFQRAAAVNVAGNAVKIAVVGATGLAFNSVALLADAAHSVADLVASAVVFVWGGSRYESADETHPHGHQRIEPLTALFVGATVAVLGLLLLRESVLGFVGPVEVRASPFLVGALLFAMVDMYLLYRYTEAVNADLGSTALTALAVDCLNDIYTTVAAMIGVIGVFLDVPILDPVAGALVSVLVVYQGVEIGRENVTYLVGGAPPPGDRERVVAALRDHPAVEGVHDLTVFYDGTDLEVEVHVEVDGEMTLRQAHSVETHLVTSLRALEDVGDVHVHLDPSGLGEWKDAPEGSDTAR
ncbi:cation diffusion facilitator family transporter [Halorubrum californiense DSM 19288]|uniref:Cation diffusion facilitator family transporter n=1 Tax=Halorubrum californiense DSM 19288 TaxID=1227465 RepID=M0DWY4_9EURY|nr:cation diffusion facilitator family transporter [Halorubrum californiense]ELZ40020.1 cation diffusion facilitator family transporter [Halorubrum californiense DSM 19288]